MTSVERIQQYSDVEQEALDYEDYRPDPNWPKRGSIIFDDMTLTYKDQDRQALGPMNVHINAGEKVLTISVLILKLCKLKWNHERNQGLL